MYKDWKKKKNGVFFPGILRYAKSKTERKRAYFSTTLLDNNNKIILNKDWIKVKIEYLIHS